MYETGKGVQKDEVEAFRWWLKAAEQGLAVAQHNVGVAYVAGLGVARDRQEAIKWLTKAAEQGDTEARVYAQRLKEGNSAASQVVVNGTRPTVRNTRQTRYGKKEEICADVVAKFVASHKYIPGEFVCVEFASGVWYELMQKGILAKVRVGGKDMNSIANHAWVMAEVSPGTWLAIEPQSGIVYPEKDARYYQGFDFSDDYAVRRHNRLVHERLEALKLYNEAVKERDEVRAKYNNGDSVIRHNLYPHLDAREYYVKLRDAEVKAVEGRLTELLERATASK